MPKLLALYGTAVERVVGVYLYSLVGLLLADGHGINVSSAHAAATAAVPAALMSLQALLAKATGVTVPAPAPAAADAAPQDDLVP